MSNHRFKLHIWLVGFLILAVISTAPTTTAQPVELEVKIEDLGVEPGIGDFTIGVFMKNYIDTITHFEFLIQLDQPSIIGFDAQIDTTGTLISGWELVLSQNIEGWESNIAINAQADIETIPGFTPGIGPQSGEIPLLKLVAHTFEYPDSLPDQTVGLWTQAYPAWFAFYNQMEQRIGLYVDTVCDSVYFRCTNWAGDLCLFWEKVHFPPYDSAAYECDYTPFIDTNIVKVDNGSVTVMLSMCGDVNGNGDIDISDITRLISFLYLHGDPPPVMRVANINGSPDGTIDISDITYIIAALYIDHRELNCPYVPPED